MRRDCHWERLVKVKSCREQIALKRYQVEQQQLSVLLKEQAVVEQSISTIHSQLDVARSLVGNCSQVSLEQLQRQNDHMHTLFQQYELEHDRLADVNSRHAKQRQLCEQSRQRWRLMEQKTELTQERARSHKKLHRMRTDEKEDEWMSQMYVMGSQGRQNA